MVKLWKRWCCDCLVAVLLITESSCAGMLDVIRSILHTEISSSPSRALSDSTWYSYISQQEHNNGEVQFHADEDIDEGEDPSSSNGSSGTSSRSAPYVVCDTTEHKSGFDCKKSIQSLLNVSEPLLLPISNKPNLTCFVVWLPNHGYQMKQHEQHPEQQGRYNERRISDGIVLLPFIPEMKIAYGVLDHLDTIQRIEATYCPGVEFDSNNANASSSLWKILFHDKSRRLRAKAFVQSRLLGQQDWHGHLIATPGDGRRCFMPPFMSHTETDKGLYFHFDKRYHRRHYAPCLAALILDLALNQHFCFINGYQPIQLHNLQARTIVQGGDSTTDNSNATPFHDRGINGTGQIVAISDSGVDTDNCYFYDPRETVVKSRSGPINLGARKIVQYVAYADAHEQVQGHGTHVAGSLAGYRNSSNHGAADGMAIGAKLSVFDIADAKSMYVPDPSTLFGPGYNAGARIHSASWGVAYENGYTNYDSAIDAFVYQNPDFLFVVAAGNEGAGNTYHTTGSPATTKNSLAVGASLNTLKTKDYLAEFSSRGPTVDGRLKPDVVAPGQSLLSARADPDHVGECDESNGTMRMTGTSMATPIVAGAAALVRQYFIEGWYKQGKRQPTFGYQPRASLVKAVVINGAQSLVGVLGERVTKSVPYDDNQGFGRVHLSSSLPIHGLNNFTGFFVNTRVIMNGMDHTYHLKSNTYETCTAPLRVTLVWTDPPVAPNCRSGCVLNDLDLYITRSGIPDRIYPNGRTTPDTTNNVERIIIDAPIDHAVYTVHVAGTNLIQNQEYSLVITGCFGPSDGAHDDTALERETGHTGLAECQDTDSEVAISDDVVKNCQFLSKNVKEYGFLCSFWDVATACPRTCHQCNKLSAVAPSHRATVRLQGDVRWYGVEFVIHVKNDMNIYGAILFFSSKKRYRLKISLVEHLPANTVADIHQYGTKTYSIIDAFTEATHVPLDFNLESGRNYTMRVEMFNQPDLLIAAMKEKVRHIMVLETEDIAIYSGDAINLGNTFTNTGGYSFVGSLKYNLVNATLCVDSAGTIELADVGQELSCPWLSQQKKRFGYLCSVVEVASFCRKTCNVCL